MKKTAVILLTIIWTIIILLVGFWLGDFTGTEYQRCQSFSSEKVGYNQEPCYAARCKPDSPGGEWICVPKFSR